MSPQEAHRLVGHDLSHTEPQPCPTRRARIVARVVLAIVIFGATVGMCAAVYAADLQMERTWLLWNETTNAAWVSPKGYQSRSTTATACALATTEAAKYAPAGTRLACRRIK